MDDGPTARVDPTAAAATRRARHYAYVSEQLRTVLALTPATLRELRDALHGKIPAATAAQIEEVEDHASRALVLVDELLDLAAREDAGGGRPDTTNPSHERAFLDRVLAVVDESLGEEGFTIDALASRAMVSRAQLYRRLKALTGLRPAMLLMQRRLERGAELLAGGASVTEAAYAVGFKNVSHFSQRFRERYRTTPSKFRATRPGGAAAR